MEQTVDQMLQQGVTAHNAGNLQEAERLYRTILQVEPKHSDANHNLGLIAVAMNQPMVALPHFEIAVEASPNIEQFWLSFIDALITQGQFEDAKRTLKEGMKKGFAKENLKTLSQKLASVQLENIPAQVPSQVGLQKLIDHFQNEQYGDAENLALFFTEKFPDHPFSYNVLGGVYKQTGRLSELVIVGEKVVALSPEDARAHSNLGLALKELGRLEESELSYKRALKLNPGFAEGYRDLGNVQKELSRLEDAVASYRQAIALKPDYAEAHSNLGVTLQELGRLEDAEASYRQAIALKPDYAKAYNNLGVALQVIGRLDEAEENHRKGVTLKPDYAEAHCNLGATLQDLGRLEEAEASYRQAIALKPGWDDAHYNLGILLFQCRQYNLAAEQFKESDSHKSKLYAIQCSYLQDEETIFYEKFDLLVNQGEINAVIGSLGFRSGFKYGRNTSNPFCNDPLKYVLSTDLNEWYDFENVFVETARDVLTDNSVSYKEQGHLTNGVQTAGNIFAQLKVTKTEIEKIIHAEIEKYRIHFKDSDEGFIKSWPTSYEISGWLVSMQSGGKLAPHMHDTGWLTGSIYIKVPPKSKTDSGNLVLCLSDQDHILGVEKSHERIIKVVKGSLCLFPSSLHHHTVPFEENEDRIVLAFDVIPAK